MSTSPPSTLGKYQIIREIARSNDIVYEAYDPLMNRRVAIKELAVPAASTAQQKEERVKRFQREVKAAGSLAHPHIVTIYEVGEDAGRHYMAMEFLDGHTLRNEIDTHGFLPPDRAVEIAMAVLDALDFAHNNGVVHRDIKPDNIQLLSDGRVKLTDFGIARLTFEPNLTMDGQVFGTPSYMSPEQVVGKEIDARSDVFGIGVVLYEMIAGQKPFSGDNVIAITHAITHKHPDPPKQASHTLWRVIEKALDKTPAMRFSSAKEMREALQRVSDEMKSGAAVLGQAPPPVANQYPNALPIYTQPYAPQPPPAQYAYNPYMPAAPVNYTPYQPTSQGLPQVPIYYPPPPRRPMVSQETKDFMTRFVMTFLIVGLFFALVVYAIIAITNAAAKPRNVRALPPPPPYVDTRAVPAPPRTNPRRTEGVATRVNPSDLIGTPVPAEPANSQNLDQVLSEAKASEEAWDWENAGRSYVSAYEMSKSPAHAEAAMQAVRKLVEEGGPRRTAARDILLKLQNAGYDNQEVQDYLATLDA
ncbi:MAG: serine/threonine protein kinase [Fimbriimonadaceae bacterium]|nr:serine/threonine protein kinase [Fimbriimonadaceae bacterium]